MSFRCCIDLGQMIPAYDVVGRLCLFEHERVRRGESQIDIVIKPGPADGFRSPKFWPYTREACERMMQQVVIPICRLLPTVRSIIYLGDGPRQTQRLWCGATRAAPSGCGWFSSVRRGAFDAVPVPIPPDAFSEIAATRDAFGLDGLPALGLADQIRSGVRPLRAHIMPPGGQYSDLVTITLREAQHWPSRNSNVSEWIKAAVVLRRLGLRVVFVRDILKAGWPIPRTRDLEFDAGCLIDAAEGAPFETAPCASIDIPSRAYLYASARFNMGVNNGPMWLAAAMDLPTMIMRPLDDGPNLCKAGYFVRSGIPSQDGTIPGMPNVTIGWGTDSVENILRTFAQALDMCTPDLTEPDKFERFVMEGLVKPPLSAGIPPPS